MLQRISSHIYMMPVTAEEKPADRPNLYYIIGEKSAAIDAGNSEKQVKKFYEALEKEGLPLPDYTIITHSHWDHTFGMSVVSGETIATKLTNQKLSEFIDVNWTISDMKQLVKQKKLSSGCYCCIQNEYSDLKDIRIKLAEREIDVQETIDLGGVNCRLIPTDSPHSPDALLILVEEDEALIIGDASYPDIYENRGKYDVYKLNEWLKVLRKLNYTLILPGHGEVRGRREEIMRLSDIMVEIQ